MLTTLWRLCRSVTPEAVRVRLRNTPVAVAIKTRWRAEGTKHHDLMYNATYYEADITAASRVAAPHIAAQIIDVLSPKSILDVGCGTGEFMEQFVARGVPAKGFELATYGVQKCHERGLDVQQLDLTKVRELPARADVVYSFEVAEHLEPQFAEQYVAALTGAAERTVVITAAEPGQQGLNHFNCQPKSYWVDLFAKRGFRYDEPLTERCEKQNGGLETCPWFGKNLLIFHKGP